MKLQSADKSDNNPFVLNPFVLLALATTEPFLGFIRWTSYSCPHCHHVFRSDFWPNNVKLGRGERTCNNCCKLCDDGSREWPELGLVRKLRVFFPPLLLGIWIGFSLAGIFAFLMPARDGHGLGIAVFAVLFGLMPVISTCPVRLIWVLRSNRRYEIAHSGPGEDRVIA
jgi:hypothetical protein